VVKEPSDIRQWPDVSVSTPPPLRGDHMKTRLFRAASALASVAAFVALTGAGRRF
jgi:hypothetical protein